MIRRMSLGHQKIVITASDASAIREENHCHFKRTRFFQYLDLKQPCCHGRLLKVRENSVTWGNGNVDVSNVILSLLFRYHFIDLHDHVWRKIKNKQISLTDDSSSTKNWCFELGLLRWGAFLFSIVISFKTSFVKHPKKLRTIFLLSNARIILNS